MSLRGKLGLAFGLIAVLALGLAAYGVHTLSATGDLVIRSYDEPVVGLSYARVARAKLNEARSLTDPDLLLKPEQVSRAASSFQRVETEIAEDLRLVRRLVHGETITNALDQAETSIAAWFASGRTILAQSPDPVTAPPTPDVADRQAAAAVGRLDELVQLITVDGYAHRTSAIAETRVSTIILVSLCGGIIVTSALAALSFGHLLIGPIRTATHIAEDVAAGNFAILAPTGRRDDIGRLLNSLAIMQANLRDRQAHALDLSREQEQTSETLRQTNIRFDIALNNMSHGLMMCDRDGRVVVTNRRFSGIYNIDPDSMSLGCTQRDVLALSIAAGNYPGRTIDDILGERAANFEARERGTVTRDLEGGRTIAVSYEPMPDGGWIAIHDDITERRRSEEQIIFLARHDALTRLPNRVLFQERLGQALARAERGHGFALLCLDLDRFKAVNDTLGHPAGDRLLQAVADRLRDIVRNSDTVARLGGDEFAILQLDVGDPSDAAVLASRIVQAISEPYELGDHRVVIGISVGIALVAGDGSNSVELFKSADLALYRAKQDGRGTWRFFEPEMDATVTVRRMLELDLREAMPLSQLELYYQPVVCSLTRTVTGFEALLRWFHPTRGMVPPSEFISVAEDIGVIVPIGVWVLRQACAEAATWPDHIRVAVNISSLQFRNKMLVTTVADAIRDAGIAPERVELEITESVMLQNDQATLSALHALRALGVRITMDDFGTGYSSLSYLRRFPFDTIKIDKSFVDELQTHAECAAIIRAITNLGGVLHMNTTAEGVETEEQRAILTDAGCTELQGYLFSKPVPTSALPALIKRLSGPPAPSFSALANASGWRGDPAAFDRHGQS